MDEKVAGKLEDIDEYFDRLETVRREAEGIPLAESEENLVRKIVSAAIDISSRIVALEGVGRPDSYAEYFEKLEKIGVIDEELARDLEEMARFRNVIVHRYHKITPEELEDIIVNDLNDVKKFATKIQDYYEDT